VILTLGAAALVLATVVEERLAQAETPGCIAVALTVSTR